MRQHEEGSVRSWYIPNSLLQTGDNLLQLKMTLYYFGRSASAGNLGRKTLDFNEHLK